MFPAVCREEIFGEGVRPVSCGKGLLGEPGPSAWLTSMRPRGRPAHAAALGYLHQGSFVLGHPPKVAWIRRGNCSTAEVVGQPVGLTMIADQDMFVVKGERSPSEAAMEEIAISRFKASCLEVLERVRRTRRPVRITRVGEPVANVVPPSPPEQVKLECRKDFPGGCHPCQRGRAR